MATHIHIHRGKVKDAPNGQRFVSNANAFIRAVNSIKIDSIPAEASPNQAGIISQNIIDLHKLIGEAKNAIAALKRIEED